MLSESTVPLRTFQVGGQIVRYEAGEAVAILDRGGQLESLTWSSMLPVSKSLMTFCDIMRLDNDGSLHEGVAMSVREADGVGTRRTGTKDVFAMLQGIDSRTREPELIRFEGVFEDAGYLALSLCTEPTACVPNCITSLTTADLMHTQLRQFFEQTVRPELAPALHG